MRCDDLNNIDIVDDYYMDFNGIKFNCQKYKNRKS